MVQMTGGHTLFLEGFHRHLRAVWNQKQLTAMSECCDLQLGTNQLLNCLPRGRCLIIFDGSTEPGDEIGVDQLRRVIPIAFNDDSDVPHAHIYCLGQYPWTRLWLSALRERRDILEVHATYERLCTRMSDQAELLARFVQVGSFNTLFLVSPWQRTVLFSAYLLKQFERNGLKRDQVQLVSVPYGDMLNPDLGERAFGQDGSYAEQWRRACHDRQALPEAAPFFPTELRNRLRIQS